MSLGPFPTGSPDGMRALASRLRAKASRLKELATQVPGDFQDLPIQASFFGMTVIEMMASGQTAGVAASRLEQVANYVDRQATVLQTAQTRWHRERDALQAAAARRAQEQR